MKTLTTLGVCVVVIILLIGAFLSGFFLSSSNIFSGNDTKPKVVSCPVWDVGQFWDYAYETPDINPTMAKTVVSTKNATQYQLGIDNRLDAQRHAVLNYNPMLGRITTNNLDVFEKGSPQNLFLFPLEINKKWKFSYLGRERWEAQVKSLREVDIPDGSKSVLVTIEAVSDSGDILKYVYDSDAKWLQKLVLTNSQGVEEVKMTLVSHGNGYHGETFFVRGVDLYTKELESSSGSPNVDFYDSFMDNGHPTWGPFDSLIYYYEMEAGTQSNALLTIRDHSTTTVLRKTFEPGTSENGIGSIPSSGGEVGVTIALQGNTNLLIMVAGGIEYSWTI